MPTSKTDTWALRTLVCLLVLFTPLFAGSLRIDLSHQFDDQPLTLNSLKYKSTETLSLSRLSYIKTGSKGGWPPLLQSFWA